jgi:hypothetical protein
MKTPDNKLPSPPGTRPVDELRRTVERTVEGLTNNASQFIRHP